MPVRPRHPGQLAQLRARFRELATPAGQRPLIEATAGAALASLQAQFRAGTDPYGAPWAPRADGGAALRSERIASSFTAAIEGAGFRISSPIAWLRAHQEGHVYRTPGGGERVLPQRQIGAQRSTGGVGERQGEAMNRAGEGWLRAWRR